MSTRRRSWWPCTVAGLVVLSVTGCAGSQDESALRAAQEYVVALADGNGAAACDVLATNARSELEQSSGTSCDEAILDEGVKLEGSAEVRVYGISAQVRYASDVLFLGRFQDAWHVTGATCSPTPRGVYDCRIKGS